METKKSQKASLESRKASMFILGMIVSVSLVLESFEWATGDYHKRDYISSGFDQLPDEIVEEFEVAQPKTKSVVQNTSKADMVKIVEDKTKIVEKQVVVKKKDELLDVDLTDLVIDGDGDSDGTLIIEDLKDIYDPAQLDISPEFPGGAAEMMAYLKSNTKYPSISLQNQSQGKAYVSFVVDKNGNITDVAIAKSDADKYCNNEAIRVIKSMPKWNPGEVHGRKVTARYIIPVSFKIKM